MHANGKMIQRTCNDVTLLSLSLLFLLFVSAIASAHAHSLRLSQSLNWRWKKPMHRLHVYYFSVHESIATRCTHTTAFSILVHCTIWRSGKIYVVCLDDCAVLLTWNSDLSRTNWCEHFYRVKIIFFCFVRLLIVDVFCSNFLYIFSAFGFIYF